MPKGNLGTINGVFIPNITMSFGVVLFLRLTIISSHVGLTEMGLIIALSFFLMLLTSLSIATIATNMKVGSGGVYYLITRTLGIEIGGALGFAIYLSQLISICVVVTAFAFLLNAEVPQLPAAAIEAIVILGLTLLVLVVPSWVLKANIIIFGLILAAITSVFLGSDRLLSDAGSAVPYYDGSLTFWQAFALFYPAMTGIESGMAQSGELKNPARAFLVGNISSIVVVALAYGALMLFAHAHIASDILKSDSFALMKYAYSSKFVMLGVYAATIASALGSLKAAPRILQSIAADGVLPNFLATGTGEFKEPLMALVVSAGLSLLILSTTSLDGILPIMTMICLITYGSLNLIASLGDLMNAPSWRPSFRLHWAFSFFGFVLSIAIMLFISLFWTLTGILLVGAVFILLQSQHLTAGFNDFRQSVVFFFSRMTLYRLRIHSKTALTWHPQILVLAKTPSHHLKIAQLANAITERSGILTFSSVVPKKLWSTANHVNETRMALENFFDKEKIACLVQVYPTHETYDGYVNLINSYGIGAMQPNTIFMQLEDEVLEQPKLADILNSCRDMGKNLVFFRSAAQKEGRHAQYLNLWWDKNSKPSFSLALSLLALINDAPQWQHAQIQVNALIAHEEAKEPLFAHLQKYAASSRVKMQVNIYFEKESKGYFPYIDKYSQAAELTCIALAPLNEDYDTQSYINNLKKLCAQTKTCGPCLFISCYDHIEHCETSHVATESE